MIYIWSLDSCSFWDWRIKVDWAMIPDFEKLPVWWKRHKRKPVIIVMIYSSTAPAKSRQSCLTLCDPRDSSLPGSPIPGILQARTLEWVAISFSNAWKWKVKVKSLSRVQLLATPWTVAHQGSSTHGTFQARVLLEWGAIAFSKYGVSNALTGLGTPRGQDLCLILLCLHPVPNPVPEGRWEHKNLWVHVWMNRQYGGGEAESGGQGLNQPRIGAQKTMERSLKVVIKNWRICRREPGKEGHGENGNGGTETCMRATWVAMPVTGLWKPF